MPETDDSRLLWEFTERQSDAAFGALATRHINLVYSVALRQSGNPDAAEEITQAVFIILARKAVSLGPKTILSGWLHQTARLTAANFLRSQNRRQQREQEAYMQSLANEAEPDVWPQIAPLLDDALGKLAERDRHAIVLRFFENKTLAEVGAALGASEDAAKMRVNRALEKLRKIFSKRGVTLTATLIAGAVATNSVQAAPVGMAITVAATAAKGVAVGGSTLALVKGALKIMAWTKAKTAIVAGMAAILAVGSTVIMVKHYSQSDEESLWQTKARDLDKLPPVLILRPTKFTDIRIEIKTNDAGRIWVLARATSLRALLAIAHNFKVNGDFSALPTRMVLPEDLPQAYFDLMLSLTNAPQEALQTEIKQRFGWIAHKENRETDSLVLRKTQDWRIGEIHESIAGVMTITNMPTSFIAWRIETWLNKPVIDETGLTNNFYFSIKPLGRKANGKYLFNEGQLRQVLQDQIGLELVPSRELVEMLVAERVKN